MKIFKNELTVLKNLNFPATTQLEINYAGHISLLKIRSANIGNPPISLQVLSELVCLTLQNVAINSITSLPNKLLFLDVSNNSLTSISFLSQLSKLDYLYLDHNKIVDLSPLLGFSRLKTLSIASNPITDFSPLTGISVDRLFVSEDQKPILPPLPNVTSTSIVSEV